MPNLPYHANYPNGGVKMSGGDKKFMCGLFNAHVVMSLFNKNATCECINCFGTHCRDCAAYQARVNDVLEPRRPTRCQSCLGYNNQKQR